jgi:hypothetical protein
MVLMYLFDVSRDSNLVKQLGITGVPTSFSLITVNGGTEQNDGEDVRLLVSDLNGKEEIDITRAWTVRKLPIYRSPQQMMLLSGIT